jgi:hypothetical protein
MTPRQWKKKIERGREELLRKKPSLTPQGYAEVGRFYFVLAATVFGIGILTPLLQRGFTYGIIPAVGLFLTFATAGYFVLRRGAKNG